MPRIVVVGASQGGLQALTGLITGLGPDFPLPILVVLHIGANPSILPSLLRDIDGLDAEFGRDGEAVCAGHIYVAPPDYHLLVADGVLELSRGPRENWARPAIDPLFRSAAASYGAGAIGIILSGQLNDGTAGLYEIKRRGGVAVIQTPSEAQAASMPRSALENVSVDYCLPVAEMGRLLARLAGEDTESRNDDLQDLFAMEERRELAEPTAQTCPECGGAMRAENAGPLAQFRCHIGHVMTAEVLVATQLELLENSLSAIVRLLNERVALFRDLAQKSLANGNALAAERWDIAAAETESRIASAQNLADQKWAHPEIEN